MRAVVIWRLVAAGIIFSSLLPAQPYFFRKDFLVGFGAYAIVPGDFNGDEKTDFMVATAEGIYVVLNAGGGNFARPVRTEEPTNAFWMPVAADFNGDGWDDLIGSGFLYLGRGDGAFLPPSYLGVQEAVAAADFNGDGQTDVVMSNYVRQEGVRVLLGNGDGTFRNGATITATPMISVRIADFDHDGRSDVATVQLKEQPRPGPGKIDLLVFLARADGTFESGTRTEILGLHVLVADFNGDQLPDLLTSAGYGSSYDIILGNGDGSFQAPIPLSGEMGPPRAAADFTGNGIADVVATVVGEEASIWPGKGDGTLLAPVELPAETSSVIATADLDGDGRAELVTTDFFSGTVLVMMARDEWAPELRRAMSSAGRTTCTSPGSFATLYAPTSAIASEGASPPWPTELGGISLEVRDSSGVARLAPLLFVSDTQINLRVPEDTALGETTLAIARGGHTTVVGSLQVDEVAPRLFLVPETEIAAATAMLVEPDGTQIPVPTYSCLRWPGGWSEYFCDYEPIPLSDAGGRPIYLSFFGTGFRGADTDNVTCSLNGVRVPVTYAGPQETPGLDQINIQLLPAVLEAYHPWFDPMVQAVVRINGVAANPVWIMAQ